MVTHPAITPWFLSDEGPTLETLDFTIHIGSTPTVLYFDLYLYSACAARIHIVLTDLQLFNTIYFASTVGTVSSLVYSYNNNNCYMAQATYGKIAVIG